MLARALTIAITLFLTAAIGVALWAGAQPAALPPVPAEYLPLPWVLDVNPSQLTLDDDWTWLPGVRGYPGADPGQSAGADPRTLLAPRLEAPPVLRANWKSLDVRLLEPFAVFELEPATAGVSEARLGLLAGAEHDAPFLLFLVNATGQPSPIGIQLDVIDVDGSGYDAVQPVALQFRLGTVGDFSALSGATAYAPDVTDGPGQRGRVTTLSAQLPAGAAGQPQVQIRVLTANAEGHDELIGIDNVRITAGPG